MTQEVHREKNFYALLFLKAAKGEQLLLDGLRRFEQFESLMLF